MGGAILMNPWARPTPWLAIALTGCILTEQWPAEQETATVDSEFASRCTEERLDRAVGCVLVCGATGSPFLGLDDPIEGFIGTDATWSVDADALPFTATTGLATWRECEAHRFNGVVCEQKNRTWKATCTDEGVALPNKMGGLRGVPLVPRAAIEGSALPALMAGAARGEPGSCLAACIAAVSRPICGDCPSGDGCFETGFADVCHPRGERSEGALCRGPQDCAALRCDAEGRCE